MEVVKVVQVMEVVEVVEVVEAVEAVEAVEVVSDAWIQYIQCFQYTARSQPTIIVRVCSTCARTCMCYTVHSMSHCVPLCPTISRRPSCGGR